MSVPAFKNSRSKVRRRRSHHALTPVQNTVCAKCGTAVMPHRACSKCGFYKNRQVIGGMKEVEKVLKKKATKKKVVEKTNGKDSKPNSVAKITAKIDKKK